LTGESRLHRGVVVMIERKINLLHLILSLETGGMERFVYENCLEMDKGRFNVSVCCIDRFGGFYRDLVESGIKVDLIQKNQKHFDLFFPLKLKKYLKYNDIHVLHIHSGAFFHGSVAGYLAKTPVVVYTEHGRHMVEPKIIFILDKISCFFTDKIVTVSPDLEKHLVEKIKLPANKIITIVNGVNTRYFVPREKSKKLLTELGIEPESKIIGSVGRLAEIKDYFTLIKSCKIIKEEIPNFRLLLVGEGPCEKGLKDLAVELGISDLIVFAGNRSDIPQILNLFDVFVLPSLLEGTSLSLLEAMASGVPSVVTNVGGNPNIVKDGYNGYLVEPKDHLKMAKKIIHILSDFEVAKYLKNNSISSIQNSYSLKINIEKYVEIYLELLKMKYDCAN
jgi:glycosyltransferase involved in cell wall biosynthesis